MYPLIRINEHLFIGMQKNRLKVRDLPLLTTIPMKKKLVKTSGKPTKLKLKDFGEYKDLTALGVYIVLNPQNSQGNSKRN